MIKNISKSNISPILAHAFLNFTTEENRTSQRPYDICGLTTYSNLQPFLSLSLYIYMYFYLCLLSFLILPPPPPAHCILLTTEIEDEEKDTQIELVQGGSNMTGTDLYVNKPHCAAAVRP